MAGYFEGARKTPAQALDMARLREDQPQIVKTWETMNIAERAAARTAELRRQAGL